MIDYTPYLRYEEIVNLSPGEIAKQKRKEKILGLYGTLYMGFFILIIWMCVSLHLSIFLSFLLSFTYFIIVGIVFFFYALFSLPSESKPKDARAAVIKEVIGFDFGSDFKLLHTGSHDYDEYLYIFSEKSFIPLKEHLESMKEGLQPGTQRRVEHRYTYSNSIKAYENRDNEKAGFTLVEDRLRDDVCGNIEMIAVDYEERTLKHTFTIY